MTHTPVVCAPCRSVAARLASTAVLLLAGVLTGTRQAGAQALYTATGPGSYIQAGITLSGYHLPYGDRNVAGLTAFVDAHVYRRLGLEVEARHLNFHTDEGVRQNTYLIGPKLTIKPHTVRPFVKLLAGRGEFRFPFGDAQGSYFVAAPGGGLDWRIGESRWSMRVVDFEYQLWPGFSFGETKPYGISSGLTYRVR